MGIKTIAASAVVAAVVVGGAGAASAVAAQGSASKAPTSCESDSHWPAYVQGRPDGFDAQDNGVYLWHRPGGGWALRVSHPLLPGGANKVVFTGRIVTQGRIGNLKRVRDERNDEVKVSDNGRALSFRLVNYGWVDGFDFTTSCTPALGVGLQADGATVQPRFVHLGDNKVNPKSDPFRIHRRDNDTSTSSAA